jgi:hypothetical protein
MNNTTQASRRILLLSLVAVLLAAAFVVAGPACSDIFSVRGLALLVVLAFASLVLVSVSSWLGQFIIGLLRGSSPWRHRALLPAIGLLVVHGAWLLPFLLAAWTLEFNFGRRGMAILLLLAAFELAWTAILERTDQQLPSSTDQSRRRGST